MKFLTEKSNLIIKKENKFKYDTLKLGKYLHFNNDNFM